MISRLHFITQDLKQSTHAEQAAAAIEGGVDWIQVRTKGKTKKEWLRMAYEVKTVCEEASATFIINDDPGIAKEVGANGVHLGKGDMSVYEARQILGSGFIIGGSTNTELDILERNEEEVDYIGLGPLRFTGTKVNLNPVLGFQHMERLAKLSKVPVIAIGGILPSDVLPLIKAGFYGVAVSSAINLAPIPWQATGEFVNECFSDLSKL